MPLLECFVGGNNFIALCLTLGVQIVDRYSHRVYLRIIVCLSSCVSYLAPDIEQSFMTFSDYRKCIGRNVLDSKPLLKL